MRIQKLLKLSVTFLSGVSLDVLLIAVGELRDDSKESKRFRNAIEMQEFKLEDYERWVDECCEKSGEQYNNALQDIVNALGKRLGFNPVEYGRYKGKKGEIGFDGLWHSPNKRYIVVEAKTTAAYTISPDKIAGYIKQLISERENVEDDNTFGLYVVGKFEPTTLEDTIRGSVHRNKLRVVTCKDLIEIAKLMRDKAIDHSQILSLMLPFDNINIGRLLQIIRDVLKVKEEETVEAPIEEEEKPEELWKTDGRKWHLGVRTTPELSEALKYFVDFVGEWGELSEPFWEQKYYVGLKHPKITPYWATVATWRVSFLRVRVRTKKGVFDEQKLRSDLNMQLTVDTVRSKKYDLVEIDIRNKSDVENEGFQKFLKDSFEAFKEIFYL